MTTATAKLLDCGHIPSAHSEHTTGTAHTQEGREVCWDCAYREELEDLKTAKHWTGYLKLHDAGLMVQVSPGLYERGQLTSWPGFKLATVTRAWRVRNNMAGYIWRFRAVDVHEAEWYGTSPGPGMYARMHKSKGR